MVSFTIRNLKIFFRDRSAVFFSLLAVFIIIGMYALFLGDVWSKNLSESGMNDTRQLMDAWIMAGMLAVTPVTTTMGAFGIMIEDKTKKITKDFIACPMTTGQRLGGYISSAIIIGVIMSLITLVLVELYLLVNGGELIGFQTMLKVLGLIVITTISNAVFVLFFVSFFQSNSAFTTASTIVGTLIGFLAGIYLPIGNLHDSVQFVIKIFPISHAAALFRQVLMEGPMNTSFADAPASAVETFKQFMGVELVFGDTIVQPWVSISVLIVTAGIFACLSIWNLTRKMKS
ncbi:MAG: ABC transporter permease [Culicoidibacterales bacterium]